MLKMLDVFLRLDVQGKKFLESDLDNLLLMIKKVNLYNETRSASHGTLF